MTRYYSATALDNTLNSSITSVVTTVTLSTTPVGYPTSGNPFVLAIDYNTAAEELVLVTAYSGGTLTVTRAFNGTTAQSHNAGALVRHVIVAQDLTDAQNHYAATTSVHGITDTSTLISTSNVPVQSISPVAIVAGLLTMGAN
jgi:hypothetical protein